MSKVGAAEWMAANHLLTPLYGSALGASVAPKGSRAAGIKEGLKQSLGPALRNDALILATSILGGKIKGEKLSKKFLKRLGALAIVGTAAGTAEVTLPKFNSDEIKSKLKKRLKKQSAAQEDSGHFGHSLGAYMGASIATPLAAKPVFSKFMSMANPNISPEEAAKYDTPLTQQARQRGSRAGVTRWPVDHRDLKQYGGAAYVPDSHPTLNKGVHVSKGSTPLVLSHELEHSIPPKNRAMRGLRNSYMRGVGRFGKLAPGLALMGGSAKNETINTYAPIAAAATTIPMLAEEARANIGGYRSLKKLNPGKKVMKQSLKAALGSMGSYAALPALTLGAGYGAKYLRNKLVNVSKESK